MHITPKPFNRINIELSMPLHSLSFPFPFPKGIQIFILFALRPFLNSNPALLNSLRAPEIGFHKKSFFLWKNKMPENKEIYTPTYDESA